jgi:hypothetical protein
MKRSLLTAVVVLSVFFLVASASAGQKNHKKDQNSNGNFQNYAQNLGLNLQSGQGQGIAGIITKFTSKSHKHHDDPQPLDPNRPDDRVPVAPVTPQGPPGFVFVNGHWERERAPKTPTMIVDPLPGSVGPIVRDHGAASQPIVRDHRTTSGPIVRDHRDSANQSGFGVFDNLTPPASVSTWQHSQSSHTVAPIVRDHRTTSGPIVRDHRTGAPQGGVSVTTTPGGTRNNDITGSGPNPLELLGDGLAKVGNVFGIGYGSITPVGDSRDHRTVTPQPIVRDHR